MAKDKSFFDISFDEQSKVFVYRSGLSVYEESIYDGMLVSFGYNFAGYPLSVLSGYPTRLSPGDFAEPSSFNLELDGQNIDFGLEFEGFAKEETENNVHGVITLVSTIKPVRLKIHTIVDGTGAFTRFIEIENLSDTPMNISRLGLFGGGLENLNKDFLAFDCSIKDYYSLGYFDNDIWGHEGEFSWHSLSPETTCVDCRFRRDRYRHPIVFIRNNICGEIWAIQTEWSGGCCFALNYNANGTKKDSYLSLSTEITGYNPLYVLSGKESLKLPGVHVSAVKGDLDEAVNSMNAHIRKSVLYGKEIDATEALVVCGMGSEHDMSVETTKKFALQMKEMGAEVFDLDAGWVCKPNEQSRWWNDNGINRPNEERYPNGLKEISDYLHGIGLKFALWVEIERIGESCNIKELHPDWFAESIFGKKTNGFLDFTKAEVCDWAESELTRIIEEYELDALRVDYNTGAKDYFALRDTGSGRKECLSIKHFNNVYKMYQNLKKRFPDILFENCAGGGGRTDIGQLKAFNHTWVSDWQRLPRSVVITNGMTMALPPERVDRLFAGMGCHQFGSIAAHIRNTMLTHMSLNVISPASIEANPQAMEFVKHSVDIYKNFIRTFLPTSRIHHHTPELGDGANGPAILEISSQSGDKGAIGIFSLLYNEKAVTVKFKGAKADRKYKVTSDNNRESFEVSGAELKYKGIEIETAASLESELLLYEEIK